MKKSFRRWIFSRYLDKGERILKIAHKHVLVLKVSSAKTSFFGILVPAFLFFLFQKGLIIFLIWGGIGVVGLIYHFTDWYFDAWLLTNVGVIDIKRNGFFDMTSTRVEYHMMEGLSYNIKGFWQTLFNYGDITIDKLGTKTSVILRDAANPKRLERDVMRYQEEFVASKSIKDHQALKGMLSEMIAYHIQNKKIKKQ